MATEITYSSVKAGISGKLKGIISAGAAIDTGGSAGAAGAQEVEIPKYTVTDVPPLPNIDFPALQDLEFSFGITGANQNIKDQLLIDFTTKKNKATVPSIILNSSRIIANAKSDYLMLFGQKGVALSSPNYVNIDADDQVSLYGKTGIFVGVPGNGNPLTANKNVPKRKGDPTIDVEYEPLVLGNKLVNLLEDILITLKNATILTPVGVGHFREDVMYEFACFQARLPELLSTVGYIDGISHNKARPAPDPPTKVTVPTTRLVGRTAYDQPTGGNLGNAVGAAAINPDDYPEGTFDSGPEVSGFDPLTP